MAYFVMYTQDNEKHICYTETEEQAWQFAKDLNTLTFCRDITIHKYNQILGRI